jgi:class 3 adenylate cyclase
MNTEDFKRKLTAIFSADVVGYSRLMGEDEETTVRTLNKYKQMIFGFIERHNGRVIDSPGDNVLAEFSSVVDAVRCGVQIQEDLKANNEGLPENRRMEFRIGINTGDVIQDGDRIYGDGVNVAARIESLADPGGICLSRTAYDQVKKNLKVEYEYLGEYEVKNIDEPVRVYKVLMDSIPNDIKKDLRQHKPASQERDVYPQSESGKAATPPGVFPKKPRISKTIWAFTGIVGLLLIAVLVLIWMPAGIVQKSSTISQPMHKQITFVGDASYPAVSPDGSFVAYITSISGELQKLMLQDMSGGQAVELFKGNNLGHPRWSPDGSQILISNREEGAGPSIVMVPRLGQASRRISEGAYACWSPDGTQIAVASQEKNSG